MRKAKRGYIRRDCNSTTIKLPDFIKINPENPVSLEDSPFFQEIVYLIDLCDKGTWEDAFAMLVAFRQLEKNLIPELGKRMGKSSLEPETVAYLQQLRKAH